MLVVYSFLCVGMICVYVHICVCLCSTGLIWELEEEMTTNNSPPPSLLVFYYVFVLLQVFHYATAFYLY